MVRRALVAFVLSVGVGWGLSQRAAATSCTVATVELPPGPWTYTFDRVEPGGLFGDAAAEAETWRSRGRLTIGGGGATLSWADGAFAEVE